MNQDKLQRILEEDAKRLEERGEVYVEMEWEAVRERLSHHRKRLGLTKNECRCLIRWWYDATTFWQLTDAQIIDFGIRLSKLITPPPPF